MAELDDGGGSGEPVSRRKSGGSLSGGKPAILIICGGLVYYHCAFRNSSFVSLVSDVFIVLLCSLAFIGLLFLQMNIQVPVDPLDWQISQDTANSIFAGLANTIGAAESVLRVAATGHDKRFFFKVVASLYVLSALGRLLSGATVAFTGIKIVGLLLRMILRVSITCLSSSTQAFVFHTFGSIIQFYAGLCLFCFYMLTENSQLLSAYFSRFHLRKDDISSVQDTT